MWSRAIAGVLLCVVGGVWIAQGIGSLGGSFMTDERQWAVIGSITAAGGIALLVSAARRRPRR